MISEYMCPVCNNDATEMVQSTYTYTDRRGSITASQWRMQCHCGAIWATEQQRDRNSALLRTAKKELQIQKAIS